MKKKYEASSTQSEKNQAFPKNIGLYLNFFSFILIKVQYLRVRKLLRIKQCCTLKKLNVHRYLNFLTLEKLFLANKQGVDMSMPNEIPENQQTNDAITISENGEVVITDPELAKSLQELSPEELDAIAGGLMSTNSNCPHTNNGC